MNNSVKRCPICQKNKLENIHYPELLQPILVPDMVWTHVTMDFVKGLPKSKEHDVVLVVVVRFTKYAHLSLKHPYTVQNNVYLFIENIYKLHGLPSVIISHGDRIFTSILWQDLFKASGFKFRFNSAYHPQSDGQT